VHPRSALVPIASILVTSSVTLAACGSTQPPPRTAAIAAKCGRPPLLVRPTTIFISCSGKVVITRIKWGEPTATGAGTLTVKGGCSQDCATARTYTYSTVRLVADQITMCPGRLRAYRVLTASVINGRTIDGHATFRSQMSNCGL
jgi:hypothetical protein